MFSGTRTRRTDARRMAAARDWIRFTEFVPSFRKFAADMT